MEFSLCETLFVVCFVSDFSQFVLVVLAIILFNKSVIYSLNNSRRSILVYQGFFLLILCLPCQSRFWQFRLTIPPYLWLTIALLLMSWWNLPTCGCSKSSSSSPGPYCLCWRQQILSYISERKKLYQFILTSRCNLTNAAACAAQQFWKTGRWFNCCLLFLKLTASYVDQ